MVLVASRTSNHYELIVLLESERYGGMRCGLFLEVAL